MLQCGFGSSFSFQDPDPAFYFSVDPDPAFHFNADLDPAFHFNADPDPAFHFNVDPDPYQRDVDPQALVYKTFRVSF